MIVTKENTKFFNGNVLINDYLNDIRKYKVPTAEEEEELFVRYANGDMSARDELILRNQRFIYSFAKQYSKNEDEVNDYVSVGNIGLIEAIENYDPTKGVKLITIAQLYIRREMRYYLDTTNNMINRSNNTKFGNKIEKIKAKYYAEFEVMPSEEEIARLIKEEYGIEVKDMRDMTDLNVTSISDEVTEDFTEEDNTDYNKATASYNLYEKEVDNEYNHLMVTEALKTIDKSHADMICKLFGIGYERQYTVTEIADEYDMTEEDVNKLTKLLCEYMRRTCTLKQAV